MSKNYEDLRLRWKELSLRTKEEISVKWWRELLNKYDEEGRAYHNMKHIEYMFQHFDSCKSLLKSTDTVAYAIFFHDIVYDPRLSDENEQESIKLFKAFAKEAEIPEDSELYIQVIHLISLTATHLTEEHTSDSVYGDEDEHYLLDFDMAILGSNPSDYDTYASQIKEEYKFLPEKAYKELRSKVLKSFLQIPKIFATATFHKQLEQQARSNIEREIQLLK